MNVREVGWRDDYVSEVCFSLDGVQLPFQASADTLLRKGRPLVAPWEMKGDSVAREILFENRLDSIGYDLYGYENDLVRRWYYTRLNLPAGRAVKLVVQYRVENNFWVRLSLQHTTVLGHHGYSCFAYDFSPAAYWGNGKAETIDVRVDASQMSFIDDTLKPVGLPMHRVGDDVWHYSGRDFDLAKAEPLRLCCRCEATQAKVADLFNHRIAPSRYTVSVSGVDPKYPAANLSDMNLATTTVLRAGAGDSLFITIRFKEPTKVSAIVFYNGYCKNAEVWKANSRAESVSVRGINREVKDFHDYTYVYNYKYNYGRGSRSRSLWQGEGKMPESFTWQGLTDAADVAYLSDFYGNTVLTELHFTITSVAKGTKYDDICVSEIILLE